MLNYLFDFHKSRRDIGATTSFLSLFKNGNYKKLKMDSSVPDDFDFNFEGDSDDSPDTLLSLSESSRFFYYFLRSPNSRSDINYNFCSLSDSDLSTLCSEFLQFDSVSNVFRNVSAIYLSCNCITKSGLDQFFHLLYPRIRGFVLGLSDNPDLSISDIRDVLRIYDSSLSIKVIYNSNNDKIMFSSQRTQLRCL